MYPINGQAHLGVDVVGLAGHLRTVLRRRVYLRDVVDGEVLRVDVGRHPGLERRANEQEVLPLHAPEEGVLLDLVGAAFAAEAVVYVTDKARRSG